LIVTNDHVARRGRVQVELKDGRRFAGTVIARDTFNDLALVQVPARDLPAVPVGDSTRLRVGELVFAVGHPWGQRNVVTAGIISGFGEVELPGHGRKATYLHSDVRLAPGNSGGPLLNAEGAVVGINAMIFGGDLSVAIPSHVADGWVAGLPSRRVHLGVGLQPVELEGRRSHRRAPRWRAAGMRVLTVTPGEAADRAGLRVGDVLLQIGGVSVGSAESLRATLSGLHTQESVPVHVLRGDSVRELELPVETREPRG
jgi:serine protease Do